MQKGVDGVGQILQTLLDGLPLEPHCDLLVVDLMANRQGVAELF